MKTKLIILLLSVVSLNMSAQSGEEVRTLIGNGKPHIGYYLIPSFQFGEIAGSTAVIPGFGAGVILNNKVSLEVKYKFISTENTPAGELDNRLYLDGQWGTIRFEYLLKPEKIVHLTFPIELGMGEIELDRKDSFENQQVPVPLNDAWFANLEPGISLEINVLKYVKFNISTGYRFVSNVKFRNLTEKDLMGITFSAGLKIGLF
jgi:hypothetical protein